MSLEDEKPVFAAAVPNWVMLERVVFRRDDESFPDGSEAPVRAAGVTTWNARFRIAFDLAEPPRISRLFAQLPTFPKNEFPLAIVATDRHRVLFRVGTMMSVSLVQDFFIYSASAAHTSSSLTALPPCAEPDMDYSRRDGRLPRERASRGRRLLAVRSMGLLCRGEEEFAVAELQVYKHSCYMAFADIYLFLKSAGKWDSMRLPILCSTDPDVIWQLCLWQTDTVIPVNRWLCWVDYERGILFYDVFGEPSPTVIFSQFPLDKFPDNNTRSKDCCWLYRSMSTTRDGGALLFINVARNDKVGYGALKAGAGFTIRCHSLMLCNITEPNMVGGVWEEDYTVTSDELWSANPGRLPHAILMFPQVDMDRPHVVHFVISEFGYVRKKMWLVTIDMSTRRVESFSQYTNGREDAIGTEGAYLTKVRSGCPMPFLPSEFSKYLC